MGNIKVSDFIVNFLVQKKIDKVFGYIGGAVAHLYDSLDKNPNIEIVNTIHEQGAGFAAEGYARVSSKTGVATATSGPGATNLITSIGSCFFDSVPTMFITGQVNTYEYKYDLSVRQIGFQETDIVSIVKPITKYAKLVDNLDDIRYELEKAYFISQDKRKGPVLLDFPMNIQRSEIDIEKQKSFFDSEEFRTMTECRKEFEIESLLFLLEKSKRPILLIGGGCRTSDAEIEINEFLSKYKLPVVYSLMGKDVVKDSYELNYGLIGAYGNRYGNFALANSDLIIVLGSRLDSRQTGTNIKLFAREAKIVHVDIDENELNAKIKADISINSDIKEFVKEILQVNLSINIDPEWILRLTELKSKFPSTIGIDKIEKIPNIMIENISRHASNDDIICVDVGQHQMWTAQTFNTKCNQRILFSGGMGAMGFAVSAAIGATLSAHQRAIVIIGDGGFQMNIQELEVIRRRNLPIKIFILNNSNLGMVRQFQEIYFEQRYIGTRKDYSTPDFNAISTAYKIKNREIVSNNYDSNIFQEILSNDEPEIINIVLSQEFTTVEPKLIVNKPIEDMHPFLDRKELESFMFIKPVEQ